MINKFSVIVNWRNDSFKNHVHMHKVLFYFYLSNQNNHICIFEIKTLSSIKFIIGSFLKFT